MRLISRQVLRRMQESDKSPKLESNSKIHKKQSQTEENEMVFQIKKVQSITVKHKKLKV